MPHLRHSRWRRSSLDFNPLTLGDIAGPKPFTVTNTSATPDVINTAATTVTGPGANDFFAIPDPTTCPSPDSLGNITLAPAGACTFDTFFIPGALGTRRATVTISDSQSSGATLSLIGVGTIGYYQVDTKGTVAPFGDAGFFGDLSKTVLNKPIVGIAQTGDDGGYWLAASDGGIFSFGDAGFFGSAGGIHLNKPIVGVAATIDGAGYWLVATDGGIFSYGDAQFYGSTGSIHLNQPIVGMAPTPDGGGYWLVASDGGIFAYGDAQFYGSTGGIHLNKPIVGMAPTPDGGGYWLVASDGGIFAYGDAQFYGSTGRHPPGPTHRGHGGHARRGRLLVHCGRRRALQLWERTVPRILGGDRHRQRRRYGNRRRPDASGVPRRRQSAGPCGRVGAIGAAAAGERSTLCRPLSRRRRPLPKASAPPRGRCRSHRLQRSGSITSALCVLPGCVGPVGSRHALP